MQKHTNGTETSTNRTRTKNHGPPWLCKKCCMTFKTRRILCEHNRTAHLQLPREHLANYVFDASSKIFSCKICNFRAEIKKEIENHVLTHEQAFTCEVCGAIIYSAYKYSVHLYQHDKQAGYKCPLCDFKRNTLTVIWLHINKVHLNRFNYKCKHCGKGFDYVQIYKEHENSHVTTQSVSCVVCKKKYPFTRNLINHQLYKHRVFTTDPKLDNQCEICNRGFEQKQLLKVHMRVHQNKKPTPWHLCEQRGKSFKTVSSLRLHSKVHSGETPYKCSYCDKAFAKRNYLINHERVHTGERPYTCDQCGKSFNQRTPLKRHKRCHTGEKPYICTRCGVGYTAKAALDKHMITTPCG